MNSRRLFPYGSLHYEPRSDCSLGLILNRIVSNIGYLSIVDEKAEYTCSEWWKRVNLLKETQITVNSEIFARILFQKKKTYLSHLKFLTGHNLLTSVNYRVISPFREAFIYAKLHIHKVSRKFPNLQHKFLS